jgi:Zn-finger nucleic acid-binding protein
MDCPACKEPLIVLEYEGVEVDYCVACQGVWLDAGELELLFGDADACRALITGGDTTAATDEKPRRCPICRRHMEKAVTRGEQPVLYDQCAHGDGLWFDQGELHEILSHRQSQAGDGKVADFLRDVFAPDDRQDPRES